jgi:hypothetical protein
MTISDDLFAREIALALRGDVPDPDPSFKRELDERVARRFDRPRRPRIARNLLSRRLVLAGGAGLVTVIAAIGAVAGLSGRGGGEVQPLSATDVPTHEVRREPAHTDSQTQNYLQKRPALVPDLGSGVATAAGQRRVEHTARLKLAAPPDDLGDVADRIVDVTDRHRGVVLSSSVSTGAESGRGGSFQLRVPTTELTDTMRDLSRLGEVRERSQFEQDVTRQYSTVADRLTSARLERRGLERRISHATSTSEADALRRRLDLLNQEIHVLRDRLGHLRVRTDYTRLSVTLVEREAAASPIGDADDALRGSLRALVNALAITLRVIAAVLPFALFGGLAWAATVALRRRRREAVLS